MLRLVPAFALLAACATPTDREVRQAWLVEAIGDDNRVWLSRDAELLAAKYARMAADPYDYMRGTGSVAFRDWSRPGTPRAHTEFGGSRDAATVLLVGDPHPENVGTYLPGTGPEPTSRDTEIVLTVEFTDFDTAGYGPWTLDVRRGAQGLGTLVALTVCGGGCQDRVIEAYAAGYADEIGHQIRGAGTWAPGHVQQRAPGNALEELVAEATEEGLARQRVLDWTRHTEDGRRLVFDEALDEQGRGRRPLTLEEEQQLTALLGQWSAAPVGFRRLDAGRRYGQGVASIPATRYVVLFDRGLPGIEDEGVVMFREVVDPPAIPGLVRDSTLLWETNGDRVVDSALRLWSRADSDPWMAAMVDGSQTFKAVTGSSFNEGLSHESLIADASEAPEPELGLTSLAEELGRLLAATHARGTTHAGEPSADAIHTDLAQRSGVFVGEVVRTSRLDVEQALLDHRLFVDALDELGPLLGADRVGP